MSSISAISVIIASDYSVHGEALKTMLDKAPGVFQVLGVVPCEKILGPAGDYQPEVVIFTLKKWEGSIDVFVEIKVTCPQTLVVMVMEREEPEIVLQALKAGVDSCLGAMTPGYMRRSLELICRGGLMIFPRTIKPGIQRIVSLAEQVSRGAPEELTNREREIYSLLLKRCSNKEIAQQLFISESTVKVHVRSILQKIGTKSRVALIDN